MNAPPTSPADAFQLGDAVVHQGIGIAPLFPRRDPVALYVTLEEGQARGLTVTELGEAGSVPELLVRNPTDTAVLLFDGEELLGAKQNRILNVPVLVAAGSEVVIPVSCVEQGRWSRHSRTFAASPHVAYPGLRRGKAERLLSAPAARGAAQGFVWSDIEEKLRRHGAQSATSAHADLHRGAEPWRAGVRRAFPLQPGQCGAVLALAGTPVCLDAVSRPEAFAVLYPKLLSGYLLDAMEADGGAEVTREALDAFVRDIAATTASRTRSVGRGDDLRLDGSRAIGSALDLDGETIQLSAFARVA